MQSLKQGFKPGRLSIDRLLIIVLNSHHISHIPVLLNTEYVGILGWHCYSAMTLGLWRDGCPLPKGLHTIVLHELFGLNLFVHSFDFAFGLFPLCHAGSFAIGSVPAYIISPFPSLSPIFWSAVGTWLTKSVGLRPKVKSSAWDLLRGKEHQDRGTDLCKDALCPSGAFSFPSWASQQAALVGWDFAAVTLAYEDKPYIQLYPLQMNTASDVLIISLTIKVEELTMTSKALQSLASQYPYGPHSYQHAYFTSFS